MFRGNAVRLSQTRRYEFLALVPRLDQQPLVWIAPRRRGTVHNRLSQPVVEQDVALVDDPVIVYPWWSVQCYGEGRSGGRSVPLRVSVSTEADSLSILHEIIQPVQPVQTALPDGKPCALCGLSLCRRAAAVRLTVDLRR